MLDLGSTGRGTESNIARGICYLGNLTPPGTPLRAGNQNEGKSGSKCSVLVELYQTLNTNTFQVSAVLWARAVGSVLWVHRAG